MVSSPLDLHLRSARTSRLAQTGEHSSLERLPDDADLVDVPPTLDQLRRDRFEDDGRKRYVPPHWVNQGAALPPEGDLRAEADQVTQAIKRVLDEMPPRQRDAATLRLRDQLSTAEIAKRLGISPRTVEGHILRAAKMMRERLPEILGETPR
ncbi:MAG: RNA polymerase sigma factor [Gemmatimonadaceae bacterium]